MCGLGWHQAKSAPSSTASPLDQAEEGQARMTANVHAGKIMLEVGGG
jgi:hypothetical protein